MEATIWGFGGDVGNVGILREAYLEILLGLFQGSAPLRFFRDSLHDWQKAKDEAARIEKAALSWLAEQLNAQKLLPWSGGFFGWVESVGRFVAIPPT